MINFEQPPTTEEEKKEETPKEEAKPEAQEEEKIYGNEKTEKKRKIGSAFEAGGAIWRALEMTQKNSKDKLNDENVQQNLINGLEKDGIELSDQQKQSIGTALVENMGEKTLDKLKQTVFEILQEKE